MNELQAATTVVLTLHQAGHTTYFAGGWVRDFLMGTPSDDIDIATSATVQEIQTLFPRTIPVGINFGIVIVVIGKHHFEVATFRQDEPYLDGRRPSGFSLATPQQDAWRRDFTLNGLFYDPLTQDVLDFVGGVSDLKTGIIRAIGDPLMRLNEDKLRMIRAIRYAVRFNFPIEAQTQETISSLAHTLFPSVAIERIWQEFQKMNLFSSLGLALVMLHQVGLLPIIFPQLKRVTLEEIQRRVQYISSFPEQTPLIVKLLELFPTSLIQEVLDLCDYLKLSKEDKSWAAFVTLQAPFLLFSKEWKLTQNQWSWASFYANPKSSLLLLVTAQKMPLEQGNVFLKEHHDYQITLAPWIKRMQEKNPIVKACDLHSLGIPNGKQMGLLLKEAEKISCHQLIEDKNSIIDLLLNCNKRID
ncbi:MAG: CCA tRNA nucleotidyltransferase [Candidatus Rhabdochlamydia sp.]